MSRWSQTALLFTGLAQLATTPRDLLVLMGIAVVLIVIALLDKGD